MIPSLKAGQRITADHRKLGRSKFRQPFQERLAGGSKDRC
jgi:hypothetical protein